MPFPRVDGNCHPLAFHLEATIKPIPFAAEYLSRYLPTPSWESGIGARPSVLLLAAVLQSLTHPGVGEEGKLDVRRERVSFRA